MATRLGLPLRVEYVVVAAIAVVVGLLAGVDPRLAIIATIGIGFVLVTVADITVGLCLFALLVFVDQLPQVSGSSLSLTKFAGVLLAASWLATVTTAGRGRNFMAAHPAMTYLLALFLAWSAVSLTWVVSLSDGAESFVRYALNLVLFLIVFTAASDRRRASWVAIAFVLAATASAAYGVINPTAADQSEGVARVGGTIGEPNEFAALLIAGLFLALALAAGARRSPALRVVALAAGAICLAGVFLSVSRAGMVALVVALVAGLLFGGRWRPLLAGAALLVAVSGAGYFVLSGASERLTIADEGSGRVDIWTVGWHMVEDRPLTGVGTGNFQAAAPGYVLEVGGLTRDDFVLVSPQVAHNIYLHILAELGLPGLLMALALFAFSLSCALRAAGRFRISGDIAMEALSRGVFLALVGLFVADFFASEHYSKQLWLLLGLAPALLALSGPSARRAEKARSESGAIVPAPAS